MNEIDGHTIAQAFYGAPMLEAEARERQGTRTDINQIIDEGEKVERLKHLEKGATNNG